MVSRSGKCMFRVAFVHNSELVVLWVYQEAMDPEKCCYWGLLN